MINFKDHKTRDMFDNWRHLGPKRRKRLDQSWAGLFREQILTRLPVDDIAKHYDQKQGRPTKELFASLGAIVLQQLLDLTDEQTADEIAFNIKWHYALDISDESDEAKYFCERTIWEVRRLCIEHDIDAKIFNRIADVLGKVFGVDPDKQRLDSTHIRSNMRKLSNIGVFVQTINKFLKNLSRHHADLFQSVPQELRDRYSKRGLRYFSMVKPSEARKTICQVAQDLYDLSVLFAGDKTVMSMTSYALLVRVLGERCSVGGVGDDSRTEQVTPRPPKDIPGDSLQNPSDSDAGYDGCKGEGYQAQIMEVFSESKDKTEKEKQLNLITHVAVESASQHDTHAVDPAIEAACERGLKPKEILGDSQYATESNCEKARDKDVELVGPLYGGSNIKDGLHLADFEYDDKDKLTRCPGGHAPVKIKTNKKRISAAFDNELCCKCELADSCPADWRGGPRRYVRYTLRELRVARRRVAEKTDAFKLRYRMRAGVEATMSELHTKTGSKRLRVRGMKAVRFSLTLKVAGLNILRASRARVSRMVAGEWSFDRFLAEFLPIYRLKNRCELIYRVFRLFFEYPIPQRNVTVKVCRILKAAE